MVERSLHFQLNRNKVTTAGWGSFTNYKLANHSAEPQGIAAGADHNLWFTESGDGKIGRISTAGLLVEFALSAGSRPQQITPGPDGNLWFTLPYANQIGFITLAGLTDEFPIPTSLSQPFGITSDRDGDLYFTEQSGNQIGKVHTTY